MSTQLKLRRGTTAQHSTFTGAEGEVTVDTTKDTLVVHDGTTAGGVPLSKESALTSGLAGKQPLASELTAIAASGNAMFKNRIINGAMVIDQRNAGASFTPVNDGQYGSCDRWNYWISQPSKISAQRSSTAPTGFSNSLLLTSLSAYSVTGNDYFTANQAIEGFNFADMMWGTANAQPVTLSFLVRSSLTGTFGGAMTNSAFNRSYPFSYTINAANTWEQKTVTIAGDTTGTWVGATNGAGAIAQFCVGAVSGKLGTVNTWASNWLVGPTGQTSVVGTSGATFYITGVQIEKGSTATSFDYRPYGTELGLCQRYYQIVRNGIMLGNSGSVVVVNSMLSPTMRTTPSLSQQGVIENTNGSTDRIQSSVSVTFANGADNSVLYTLGNFSGLTANVPYAFRLGANTNGVTASAEL